MQSDVPRLILKLLLCSPRFGGAYLFGYSRLHTRTFWGRKRTIVTHGALYLLGRVQSRAVHTMTTHTADVMAISQSVSHYHTPTNVMAIIEWRISVSRSACRVYHKPPNKP